MSSSPDTIRPESLTEEIASFIRGKLTMSVEDENGLSGRLLKISISLILLLFAGGLTWGGWVTLAILDRPTRSEQFHAIETTAPYNREKSGLEARLNNVSDQVNRFSGQFSIALDRNTEAINQLRLELAKIGSTRTVSASP